ncbi:MAG: GNAT family N-acetyltransferase [Clostridium sp.]|nr:MAG: GNAT family N-acetyltransferase [Clostridium sp.]
MKKMVGFILFNDVYGDIEICYIAVIEEYRRRHIASKLIDEVLKLMKNMCSLDVRSKNIAAIALYKSLGFVPVYIRKKLL